VEKGLRDYKANSQAPQWAIYLYLFVMFLMLSFDFLFFASPGYGPHITVINHDADSTPQKGGSSAPSGLIGGAFLGPPGRIGMITGAPSPHQLSRQGR